MTTKKLFTLLGQKGLLSMDGLRVQVEIVDVKQAYGKVNVQVKPIAGTGVKWVSLDRVNVQS